MNDKIKKSILKIYNLISNNRVNNSYKYSWVNNGNGWSGQNIDCFSFVEKLRQYESIDPFGFSEIINDLVDGFKSINASFGEMVYLESGSACNVLNHSQIITNDIGRRINDFIENGESSLELILNSIYAEIVEFLTSDTVISLTYGPIENLVGNIGDINLGDVKIVRLQKGDIFESVNCNKNFGFNYHGFVWEYFYIIESPLRYSFVNHFVPPIDYINKYKNITDKLEVCMSVFGKGSLRITKRYSAVPRFFPFLFGSYEHHGPKPMGVFEINPGSIDELKNLYDHSKNSIFGDVKFSARRLLYSENRFDPLDSIVDSVIGMEGILLGALTGGDKGELKYRFSLNYSTFFETPQERECAFNFSRSLYDIRSAIVHGDEARLSEKDYKKINSENPTPHGCSEISKATLRALIINLIGNNFNIKDQKNWNYRILKL